MLRILLLAVLLVLQSASARADSPNDCQGAVWRKTEAGVGEDSNLKEAVGFLQSKGLAFDSIELADHDYEPRVKAYIADGIKPGCSIYVSEWLPLKESEIKCFPFATRTHEFISIDFDTSGRLIGLQCSSAVVKMSCEDARRSLHAALDGFEPAKGLGRPAVCLTACPRWSKGSAPPFRK